MRRAVVLPARVNWIAQSNPHMDLSDQGKQGASKNTNMSAGPETITLLVHKLECAPNVQLFGTQDPFVIAQLQVTDAVEVDPEGSFACTDWVQNGGCSCAWTAEHSNELQLKFSATDPKNISILLVALAHTTLGQTGDGFAALYL